MFKVISVRVQLNTESSDKQGMTNSAKKLFWTIYSIFGWFDILVSNYVLKNRRENDSLFFYINKNTKTKKKDKNNYLHGQLMRNSRPM